MPHANPLIQLIPNRIAKLRQQLEGLLWSDFRALELAGGPVSAQFQPLAEAMRQPMTPMPPGELFGAPGGAWQQRWLRLDVPAPVGGRARWLHWDCNGETTAYLDGEPWAGLDVAHTVIKMPDRACTLWLDCGTYQTCVWHPGRSIESGGLRFVSARLAHRDEGAWEAYWDLQVLVHWLEQLLRNEGLSDAIKQWGPYPDIVSVHPVLRRLLHLLEGAHAAYERGGVAALAPLLKAIYAAFPAESWQMPSTMIGHSHLDLVWLWPEVVGERKAVHTISTALRLLEQYPEYRFMWTSPATYRMLARCEPALLERVKQAIASGRWEATGGAYIEPECLLAGGEALVRALVLGQRVFMELRGEPSQVFWVPDCFGFPVSLPQLLRLAGITGFATGKLGWNAVTRFPYQSFTWRSPDGSSVLSHFLLSPGDTPGSQAAAARDYRQGDVHHELFGYVGVGDGGGGTTIANIEQIRRLDNLALTPRARWGGVESFFDRLAAVSEQLPLYEGELYLEFHRGVCTTQTQFKLLHRRCEAALRTWEAVRALAGGEPLPEDGWERLVFSQFHDALPGSSIDLVYQQLGADLLQCTAGSLFAAAAELSRHANIDAAQQGLTVFNPLPHATRQVLRLPAWAATGAQLCTSAGATGLAIQVDADGFLVAVNLTGLQTVVIEPGGQVPQMPTWQVGPSVLSNGVLRVDFDEAGRIISAADEAGAWALAGPVELLLHPDLPPHFDAWDIDHCAIHRIAARGAAMSLRVIETGPVRAILRGEAPLGDGSRVRVDYILEAGADTLRIDLHVDWREQARLLSLVVPTTCHGRDALFGAPYGTVARCQVPATAREEAAFEVPATRWAAVADDAGHDGVLMLLERSAGLHVRDGQLGLSLLRSAQDPAYEFAGQCVSDRRPAGPPDHGEHHIRLALTRFRGRSGAGMPPAARAEALFVAPLAVPGVAASLPAVPVVIAGLESVIPAWILPASGGARILRLFESAGRSGTIIISINSTSLAPIELTVVDLLERPQPEVVIERRSPTSWSCRIGAYQLLSLRLS